MKRLLIIILLLIPNLCNAQLPDVIAELQALSGMPVATEERASIARVIHSLRRIAGTAPESGMIEHISPENVRAFDASGESWETWYIDNRDNLTELHLDADINVCVRVYTYDHVSVDANEDGLDIKESYPNPNNDCSCNDGDACIPEPEIPEQFDPETIAGTYYNTYHDGEDWRIDTLIFSKSDGECTSPHITSCGNMTAEGQYAYESRWELWDENEGMILSWDIPAFGKQWIGITTRTDSHFEICWKISKGDLIVALRDFSCAYTERFFFDIADAEAFVSANNQ